eukprot:TRINITY_DN3518_c0_g2_i1.p1 TRINITY_DN3518_c0_g2~~TRINITY_DN3518_c0_g2_i1.p1  ORF type:complete len:207 (+),score=53.78 TRINITY_DN3518_c0_g2_i1:59-679(+)
MFFCCAPKSDEEEIDMNVPAWTLEETQQEVLPPSPKRQFADKPQDSDPDVATTEAPSLAAAVAPPKEEREEDVKVAPPAEQAEATAAIPEAEVVAAAPPAKQAEATPAFSEVYMKEFDVKLEKVVGMGLGLELVNRTLRVKEIINPGMIHSYNESVGEAGLKVQPGHTLLSFNGVDRDPLAILNTTKANVPSMKAGGAINLRFRVV